MTRVRSHEIVWLGAVMGLLFGCAQAAGDDDDGLIPNAPGAGTGTATSGTGVPLSGSGAPITSAGNGGKAGTGSANAGSGMPGGAGTTAEGAGTSGGNDDGGTAGTGMPIDTSQLAPSVRNPAYSSIAPPLGQPLPASDPGMWTYIDIDGALSRDGSPAGFYYKRSMTGDANLMIYLAGGGACQDEFFCNMNPPNKDFSLTAESVVAGVLNVAGPDPEAQDPRLERWNSGIFKNDPSNPVKDWNMVFIPYVTGDVFAGSRPNATVPDVPGTFQFVGRLNMLKFLPRIVATFQDAKAVVLTGSSAGGLGALLTAPFLMDAYIDLGKGARGFVLDDAGPFFDDPFMEVCLQQRYRDLFGLNDSFPADCPACKGEGGGITATYLAYLVDKYPDNLLGGLIDSESDEIMSFFFSEGLEDCAYINDPITGLLAYPADRYKNGLQNLLDVHMKRMSSYVWPGIEHQNLFMTATADRFYETNGLDKTVAQWLAKMLTGEQERLGL